MVKYLKNKFGSEVHYKIIFQWYVEFTLNAIDPTTGSQYLPEYYSPQHLNRPGMIENSNSSASQVVLKKFKKAAISTRIKFPRIKKIDITPATRKYYTRTFGREANNNNNIDSFHKHVELKIITDGPLTGVNAIGIGANQVAYNIAVFGGSELASIYDYFKKILYNNYPLQMNDENIWLYPPPTSLGLGRIECFKISAQADGYNLL